MSRKSFLKNASLTVLAFFTGSRTVRAKREASKSTYDQLTDQVGFNHLPNQENRTMKSVLHKADSRGHAIHGWLNSHHSFSFANYYNPERMNFGVLRVLNDDIVEAGRGFSKHPHDNMEIISIPLEGDLEHKDSMGNIAVIRDGDIQVMSAGTGIYHSEYNRNQDKAVKFLQIWLFPKKKDVAPRYDQMTLNPLDSQNKLQQILSPSNDDEGVWIHQDAWFHIGNLEANHKEVYQLKKEGNGIYLFILEGELEVEGQVLNKRDGYGLWDISEVSITALSKAKILLMEVPMLIS